MKPIAIIILFLTGLGAGWFIEAQRARVAVLSGPYSDNYGPALTAIADAKARLQAGDTNVMTQLQTAETNIQAAQTWSRRFLDQQ